jgi:lipoprotein-releasing system ATP-binding protein
MSDVLPLEARDLRMSYVGGDGNPIEVLQDVSLALAKGEAVAITGVSGAGKSTLLHLLGALDRPTSGAVFVGGRDVAGLAEDDLAAVRNRHIGFVFQFHHLLREFTALENVMMPALLAGLPFDGARSRARALLGEVGLEHREGHKPRQLSGGEQQRVAVARALVNEPLVLLADEPSGNLDTHTGERLHDVLFGLRAKRDLSLVLVTHNADLAGRADRILRLQEGRLQPGTRV